MLAVGSLVTATSSSAAAARRGRAVRATASLSGAVPGGGMRGRRPRARGALVVAHGKKEDAARRALLDAMGSRSDPLAQFDDSGGGGFGGGIKKWFGGGGGGDNDNWQGKLRTMGAFGLFGLIIAVFALFKPVTAILVNLIYYLARIPTGREPGAEKIAEPAVAVAADADIIARYGADDDEDDEDDEDE